MVNIQLLFFMGDVGSFAFGTSLGVVAMLTNTLFLLPVIGILFVVEAGSSLIQIVRKKVFHRKIFVSAGLTRRGNSGLISNRSRKKTGHKSTCQ